MKVCNIENMRKYFNNSEIEIIKEKASIALQTGIVQQYFQLGKHDVCIERENRDCRSLIVSRMETPLWMNQANVECYNKRKKG